MMPHTWKVKPSVEFAQEGQTSIRTCTMEPMDELNPPRRLNFKRVVVSIFVGVLMFIVGFGLRALMETSSQSYQLLSPRSEKVEPPPNPYSAYSLAALRIRP